MAEWSPRLALLTHVWWRILRMRPRLGGYRCTVIASTSSTPPLIQVDEVSLLTEGERVAVSVRLSPTSHARAAKPGDNSRFVWGRPEAWAGRGGAEAGSRGKPAPGLGDFDPPRDPTPRPVGGVKAPPPGGVEASPPASR